MFDRIRYALSSLLRRSDMERGLDDEIRYHIERETEKNIAKGMTPDAARRQARVVFGGRDQLKEAHRDARGARWLEDFMSDLSYGLRALRGNLALAIAVTLTLALGIGANTAIFSTVSAVLIRPLPFREPDRLVMVGENNKDFNWTMADAAPANYLDWRTRVPGFEDAMAYTDFGTSATLLAGGTPRLVATVGVTGNFFSTLGIAAQLGRGFTFDETWSGSPSGVTVSDRLWRQELGANPGVIGTSISLNGKMVPVIGVAPRGFAFPTQNVDVWTTMEWDKAQVSAVFFRRAHWLRVIARLKPGVTVEQANTQLQSVAGALKHEYPATNRIMEAQLVPLHRFLVGDARLPLLVLLTAVTLLMLIACANVGNLLLVRASNRQREMAVRAALGASRSRLMRQAFAESLLLSFIGGAIGLALGAVGTRALLSLQPAGGSMLPVSNVDVDWRVAAYVFGVSLVSGTLFGIAPALWAARRAPSDALGGGRTGSAGVRARRGSEVLAVAEVAIALALTAAAALLVRSYQNLRNVDPGFVADGVLATTLQLPESRYDTDDKIRAFFGELETRVGALPGVQSAGLATHLPLTGPSWSSDFSIQGASAGHFGATLLHRQMTPGYLATMRVPLRRGRWFTAADRGNAYVVVINETFAKEFFKGQDPIGQQIAFDRVTTDRSTWRTVVGVVGDEHQVTPATPPGIEVFAPFAQEDSREASVVARTTGDPASLAPAIRKIVHDMDPALAIGRVEPLTAVRDASMARDRFLMALISMFSIVGLVLAAVGVYGVLAQVARGRTREMGIRIALGAHARTVQWLIVRRGFALAALGILAGGTLAVTGMRGLGRLLYGVAPGDPATLTIAAATIFAATLAASWIPALRSCRVDPVTVLRQE